VEVGDVIEMLGICAGIIASLGTVVVILYYLCRQHRWRFIFDIIACLAVAAIPVLIYRNGNVPFITYILLGSLCGIIIITEYLLNYIPLLTWLCLAIGVYKYIKNCVKQSTVIPLNQNRHYSEAKLQIYD
jgi:predicted membrane channel-forming protein YqfA (hemolysin III family)